MVRRVRNCIEKKLLHSRIVMGIFPNADTIVQLAKDFLPQQLITINVTTSATQNKQNVLVLTANNEKQIISHFNQLTVTLIPEGEEEQFTREDEKGREEKTVKSKVKDRQLTGGFEPNVQRKTLPAPAVPPSSSNPTTGIQQQRHITSVSASATVTVRPGKYGKKKNEEPKNRRRTEEEPKDGNAHNLPSFF